MGNSDELEEDVKLHLLSVDEGEEEEEVEEEFNEEESRKTDEMMGVIDGAEEPIQDEIIEETALELEGISDGIDSTGERLQEQVGADLASNSIVLLPSTSPRKNSQSMIYENRIEDDFEMVQEEQETEEPSGPIKIEINESFEDVSVTPK